MKLGGVILAAGLSSRMGSFKPLIEIEGRSMIKRVVDMMRWAGAETIVIVTGYRREDLEAHLADENVEFAYNAEYSSSQQLDSLKIGLAALEGHFSKIIMSPVDIPMVNQKTVRKLAEKEGDFIRPVYEGRAGHPVFIKGDWIPYIMEYDGPRGLRGAIESNENIIVHNIEVSDEGVLLDNDTQEDLKYLFQFIDMSKSQYISY